MQTNLLILQVSIRKSITCRYGLAMQLINEETNTPDESKTLKNNKNP